jgi:large subunit ribosomal protein L25
MASVRDMKATTRAKAGKGAARAERRAGRVPGVIYGDNKPPLPISVDHAELKQRIYAGRFLTTIYELDVDGEKHRVIPRDYQLDPVRDHLVHVDFLRVGEGARLTLEIPVHFMNEHASPGIKRGGALNIVRHTIELRVPVDAIPEAIEVDLTGLDIGDSLHISAVTLPEGVVPTITDRDFTIATIAGHGQAAAAEDAAAAAEAEAGGAGGAEPKA